MDSIIFVFVGAGLCACPFGYPELLGFPTGGHGNPPLRRMRNLPTLFTHTLLFKLLNICYNNIMIER
jgi:hypothetical protein